MELQNIKLPTELTELQMFYAMEALDIKTEGDVNAAGEYLKTISMRTKAIKSKVDDLFGPIKRHVRDFEITVKDRYLDPLKKIDESLRKKMQVYWDSKQKELEKEEERKIEEEKKRLKLEADSAANTAMATGSTIAAEEATTKLVAIERLNDKPIEVRQTVKTTGFTMAQMRVWKWRLIDEKKVPEQWFVLDEAKLNAAARGYSKNPISVEGIEFYQESKAMIR